MNRFSSLKYVQYFDVHNSNLKKGKEKKRKKKYTVYNFKNLQLIINPLSASPRKW